MELLWTGQCRCRRRCDYGGAQCPCTSSTKQLEAATRVQLGWMGLPLTKKSQQEDHSWLFHFQRPLHRSHPLHHQLYTEQRQTQYQHQTQH